MSTSPVQETPVVVTPPVANTPPETPVVPVVATATRALSNIAPPPTGPKKRLSAAVAEINSNIQRMSGWIGQVSKKLIKTETTKVFGDALVAILERYQTGVSTLSAGRIRLTDLKKDALQACENLPTEVINELANSPFKVILLAQKNFNNAVLANESHVALSNRLNHLINNNEFDLALALASRHPQKFELLKHLFNHLLNGFKEGTEALRVGRAKQSLSALRVENERYANEIKMTLKKIDSNIKLIVDLFDWVVKNTPKERSELANMFRTLRSELVNMFIPELTQLIAILSFNNESLTNLRRQLNRNNASDEDQLRAQINDAESRMEPILKVILPMTLMLKNEPYFNSELYNEVVKLYALYGKIEQALNLAKDIELTRMRSAFFTFITDQAILQKALPDLVACVNKDPFDGLYRTEMCNILLRKQATDQALEVAKMVDPMFLDSNLLAVLDGYLRQDLLAKAQGVFRLMRWEERIHSAYYFFVEYYLRQNPPNFELALAETHKIPTLNKWKEFCYVEICRTFLRIGKSVEIPFFLEQQQIPKNYRPQVKIARDRLSLEEERKATLEEERRANELKPHLLSDQDRKRIMMRVLNASLKAGHVNEANGLLAAIQLTDEELNVYKRKIIEGYLKAGEFGAALFSALDTPNDSSRPAFRNMRNRYLHQVLNAMRTRGTDHDLQLVRQYEGEAGEVPSAEEPSPVVQPRPERAAPVEIVIAIQGPQWIHSPAPQPPPAALPVPPVPQAPAQNNVPPAADPIVPPPAADPTVPPPPAPPNPPPPPAPPVPIVVPPPVPYVPPPPIPPGDSVPVNVQPSREAPKGLLGRVVSKVKFVAGKIFEMLKGLLAAMGRLLRFQRR